MFHRRLHELQYLCLSACQQQEVALTTHSNCLKFTQFTQITLTYFYQYEHLAARNLMNKPR